MKINRSSPRQKLREFIATLNLFPSIPPSTDEYDLRWQRLSTKFFVILLLWLLLIVTLYNSLIIVTKSKSVDYPNLEEYLQLYSKYGTTLTCLCNETSIAYKEILSVTYTFHQVCSSDFISEEWLQFVASHEANMYDDDYRKVGPYILRGILIFCQAVNETVADSLNRFYFNKYISTSIVSRDLLQSIVDSLALQFISSTTENFLLSLDILRGTTQANALLGANQNNYFFYLTGYGSNGIRMISNVYNQCDCRTKSTCHQSGTFESYPTIGIIYKLSGLNIGCHLIDALMQSTLECYYTRECIDQIRYNTLTQKNSSNPKPLNSSLKSQYLRNTTIEIILDQLMIERWNWSLTYQSYYQQCDPYQCTYTTQTTNDFIYIFTLVVGLIGGLVTVLKIIVPFVVKLVLAKRQSQTSTAGNKIQEFVRNPFSKTKMYALHFNLFPAIPPSTSIDKLRQERISTRLFLVLFSVGMVILVLYTSLVTITNTIPVNNPTIDEYRRLYSTYGEKLTCPCNKISITYDRMINITYTFHQVCQSDFVSDSMINEWTQNLNNYSSKIIVQEDDFVYVGPYILQSLKVFCQLVNKTINGSLSRFYSEQYISLSVTSENILKSQMNAFVTQFQSSTRKKFLISLEMIRSTTQANGLISALESNYGFYRSRPNSYSNTYLSTYPKVYSSCSCAIDKTCVQPAVIRFFSNSASAFYVPGMYTGCYPIEGLIQSNLGCFYSSECIRDIWDAGFFSSSHNIRPLNSSISRQYLPNTTIEVLLNQLLVEQWDWSVLYEKYYEQCRPDKCMYIEETRNNFIQTVTLIMGLVGGLVTILRIIVPFIVKLLQKKHDLPAMQPVMTFTERIHLASTKMIQFIKNFNLFPSIPPSTNIDKLRHERIATRLFLVLFSVGMVILVLYTSLVTITNTIPVNNPTIDEYRQLYLTYGEKLTCPCNKISITYDRMINITYTFHQVCQSDFISRSWLKLMQSQFTNVSYNDYRRASIYIHQSLMLLCELVNKTMDDSVNQFYLSDYISVITTPENLLQSQINSFVSQFLSTTTKTFLQSFQLIRSTTYANALASGFLTGYDFVEPVYYGYSFGIVKTVPLVWSSCSCGTVNTCIQPALIYQDTYNNITGIIPGMFIGCYVIEALLQSTLECFYSAQCINLIMANTVSAIDTTPLNSSLESQYSPKTTVQIILDQLMLEKWNWSMMYHLYYNECRPSKCSYTYKTTNAPIYIVTTVIGLLGGLVTALNFGISQVFMRLLDHLQKRKGTIKPIASLNPTETSVVNHVNAQQLLI